MKVETQLLSNHRLDQPAFGIVHWNAPDFLLLNVKQIRKFHPASDILIFDNNSSQTNFEKAFKELVKLQGVTLFRSKRDYSGTWACHTIALQFLLNYAATTEYTRLAFLDQDCLLATGINALTSKLCNSVLLVGVRDYVVAERTYGVLKYEVFRRWFNRVHASFMIMNPKTIRYLFGDMALMDGYEFEPYHGLSRKLVGNILYLETKMHSEVPMLTEYMLCGITYAWHSWYSSRALTMKDSEYINELPVSWVKESVLKSYRFMKELSD